MSAIALGLLAAGWLAAAGVTRPEPLRSRHSEPATARPPSLVAVTSEGKLYHRPDCAYIHGPVQMESGEQAIAEGYTPCTRCLNERR
jgi:hypothetical protein